MLEIVFAIAVLAVLAGIVWMLERRLKTHGALFTESTTSATPLWRLLALLLGLLFAGLFVMELISSSPIHIWFPILAIALIGYSIGLGGLLNRIQGQKREGGNSQGSATSSSVDASAAPEATIEEVKFSLNQPTRFLITLAIVILALAAALYGTIWVITHPDSPVTTTHLVIGLIVLAVLARLVRWYKLLESLLKLFTGKRDHHER
ncbi:MAG: hypothetical protein HYZ49_06135 [Chloroflexi bacterium]|nr:hypothetical protein [Chloroflexota bacterium]